MYIYNIYIYNIYIYMNIYIYIYITATCHPGYHHKGSLATGALGRTHVR